jgi:hypothetical protein
MLFESGINQFHDEIEYHLYLFVDFTRENGYTGFLLFITRYVSVQALERLTCKAANPIYIHRVHIYTRL